MDLDCETLSKADLNDMTIQAEQRLIRQKVKRKKRPSHISGGGGGRNHNLPANNEVPTSKEDQT